MLENCSHSFCLQNGGRMYVSETKKNVFYCYFICIFYFELNKPKRYDIISYIIKYIEFTGKKIFLPTPFTIIFNKLTQGNNCMLQLILIS